MSYKLKELFQREMLGLGAAPSATIPSTTYSHIIPNTNLLVLFSNNQGRINSFSSFKVYQFNFYQVHFLLSLILVDVCISKVLNSFWPCRTQSCLVRNLSQLHSSLRPIKGMAAEKSQSHASGLLLLGCAFGVYFYFLAMALVW